MLANERENHAAVETGELKEGNGELTGNQKFFIFIRFAGLIGRGFIEENGYLHGLWPENGARTSCHINNAFGAIATFDGEFLPVSGIMINCSFNLY